MNCSPRVGVPADTLVHTLLERSPCAIVSLIVTVVVAGSTWLQLAPTAKLRQRQHRSRVRQKQRRNLRVRRRAKSPTHVQPLEVNVQDLCPFYLHNLGVQQC